jgi:hypothetical protein
MEAKLLNQPLEEELSSFLAKVEKRNDSTDMVT